MTAARRPTLAELAAAHRAQQPGRRRVQASRKTTRPSAAPGQHPLELTAAHAGVHDQVARLLTAGAAFTVTFTVPGKPVPKERPRRYTDPQSGETRTYTPHNTVNAEVAVADCCRLALRGAVPPTGGLWGIIAVFYLPDLRGRDSDNLVKLVKDALQGVTWSNDSQVTCDFVALHLDRERPRSVITAWQPATPGPAGGGKLRRGGYQETPVHATIGGPVPVPSLPEDAPGHANGPHSGGRSQLNPVSGPASPVETYTFSSKGLEPR